MSALSTDHRATAKDRLDLSQTRVLRAGEQVDMIGPYKAPQGSVVAFDKLAVNNAVSNVAQAVRSWIDEVAPAGAPPVVLLAVLNGGAPFRNALSGRLEGKNITCCDIKVSTRNQDGSLLTTPMICGDLSQLAGKNILIVDDVHDSGETIRRLENYLAGTAKEVRAAVLVNKTFPGLVKVSAARYIGLEFQGNLWLGGFGMDMPGVPDQYSRATPFILCHPPIQPADNVLG